MATVKGHNTASSYLVYGPTLTDRGYAVFGLFVCLSAKTFTLAIAFTL